MAATAVVPADSGSTASIGMAATAVAAADTETPAGTAMAVVVASRTEAVAGCTEAKLEAVAEAVAEAMAGAMVELEAVAVHVRPGSLGTSSGRPGTFRTRSAQESCAEAGYGSADNLGIS